MPKKKERSPEEHYRGIIRSLKSEIRNLKKQLSQYRKQEHFYEDNKHEIEDLQLPLFEEVKTVMCPECSKGELEDIIVVGRYFRRCTQCTYRTKTKLL